MFPTRKFTSIARNFQSFVKSFFFYRKEKLKNQKRFMEKMSENENMYLLNSLQNMN